DREEASGAPWRAGSCDSRLMATRLLGDRKRRPRVPLRGSEPTSEKRKRDDSIIPRYGAAGVRKFALHVPAGAPNTMEAGGTETVEGPAVFPTAWFSDRQHALDWFKKT